MFPFMLIMETGLRAWRFGPNARIHGILARSTSATNIGRGRIPTDPVDGLIGCRMCLANSKSAPGCPGALALSAADHQAGFITATG